MNNRLRFWTRMIQRMTMVVVLGAGSAYAQYAGPAITSLSPQPSVSASATNNVEAPEATILPGDVISITTYGAPELSTTYMTTDTSSLVTGSGSGTVSGMKVGSKGEIVLPYVGTVKIAGLTASQAAEHLAKALKDDDIMVDPQVSIQLVDSPTRVVTVLGEVQKPALVPGFGKLRLLDVISACGGFTSLASHVITVRRPGVSGSIDVELGTDPKEVDAGNIPIFAGDTIVVPKVGDVYVLGEVKNPAAFPLSSNTPITVMRALSMAGGLKYSAALSKSKIIRTDAAGQRVEFDLDLSKIMHSKEADMTLLSDDVLLIPANSFKAAISTGAGQVAASALYGFVYLAK